MSRQIALFLLGTAVCFLLTGCALLNAPFQMLGMAGNLVGQALNLASQLPTPPAWMFF